jgi:hypothetical protein
MLRNIARVYTVMADRVGRGASSWNLSPVTMKG